MGDQRLRELERMIVGVGCGDSQRAAGASAGATLLARKAEGSVCQIFGNAGSDTEPF
jgi:hypothetical protein